MKLNKLAFALATGIFWGAIIFLATWWIIIRKGTGEHIELLGRFYLGYKPTPPGSLIGLIYGFVSGFVGGYIFSALYNAFVQPPVESTFQIPENQKEPSEENSQEL
ncbi:MAG: bacteriophage holin [Candidatus Sumerlaeia bacterium]|nr:bacteriophage holin [Candidatus Sumerlaeia bacterium]